MDDYDGADRRREVEGWHLDKRIPIATLVAILTLAAMFITLADPRTAAGLDALVAMGLLTATRRDEIIGAMQ